MKQIFSSKKPIFYVGGGAVQSDASEELKAIMAFLRAPITNTLMGLGAFPGTDKQCLGMLGMHGTYQANMAMHEADLIVAVGARFDDRVTNNPDKFCPEAKIIHIDIDPASIAKIIDVDIPIVGDVKAILSAMSKTLESLWSDLEVGDQENFRASIEQWWGQIETWREAHGLDHSLTADRSERILPQAAIKMLYQVT